MARDGSDTRTSIVEAAAGLLHDHGPDAVTTRRVAADAGVHAPAIYRLFGDRDGLIEAVAEHVMAQRVAEKRAETDAAQRENGDPVDDLREGWLQQVDFAIANPALFRLLSDPVRVRHSQAARAGRLVLEDRVHRVARAGRLRVGERRATDLLQSAAVGVVQTMLSTDPDDRDLTLVPAACRLIIEAVTTGDPATADPLSVSLTTVRSHAADLEQLTEAEQRLLAEWLARASDRGPL